MPEHIQLVATSAARAANRDEFANAIEQATGQCLRVLSGKEEALGIAAGLQRTPVPQCGDLSVFDIGGGSLEQ